MLQMNNIIQENQIKKKQLESTRKQQNEKSQEVASKRDVLESALKLVTRQLNESLNQVKKHLKPEALNEIKTLRVPPKTVKDILDVLFIFLDLEDTSWSSIKMHLTKLCLRDELANYNFQKLSKSLLDKVKVQMEAKQTSFQEEQAGRASIAILPIVGWIKAAVEYGRVQLKLEPLENELHALEVDLTNLKESAGELESEQKSVEARLELDKCRLERLRLEHKQSKERLEAISLRIEQAERARANCEQQVDRWRNRLGELNQSFRDPDTLKVCLVACCMALVSEEDATLADASCSRRRMMEVVLDSMQYQLIDDSELAFQLSLVKLCLKVSPRLIAFVELDEEEDIEQQLELLSYQSILVSNCEQITLLELDKLQEDLGQTVQLVEQLNKLLVLVISQTSPPDRLLDFLTHIHESQSKAFIVIGKLSDQVKTAIGHRLRFFRLKTSDRHREESITRSILDSLMSTINSKLRKDLDTIGHELQATQDRHSKLEIKLLHQLAKIESEFVEEVELDESTLRVLAKLQELDEKLAKQIHAQKSRLLDLQTRQESYRDFAVKATAFYKAKLSGLDKLDPFYRVSPRRYQHWLLESVSSSDGVCSKVNLSFEGQARDFVIQQVVVCMRAQHADQFMSQVSNAHALGNLQEVVKSSPEVDKPQLEEILLNQIELLSQIDSRHRARLAMVMHEPGSGSPQVQIDELFRSQPTSKAQVSYLKVYASSEAIPRALETALVGPANQSGITKELDEPILLRCVCVVNAQLASRWFETVPLFEKFEAWNSSSNKARLLLVLVGESASSAIEHFASRLSGRLCELAQVRFWYEEHSLDLVGRWRLLNRWLASHYKCKINARGLERELAQQLVLIQAVCQELARLGRWAQANIFNQDQLWLALRQLDTLMAGQSGNQEEQELRSSLANYLADVVYGSRMETGQDEQLLIGLLSRFLRSGELARVQLDRMQRLLDSNSSAANRHRLASDLLRF